MPGLVSGTWLVPVAYVFAGFDPYNYFIDFVISPPVDRDLITIVVSWLCRLLLTFYGCLEIFRGGVIVYFALLLLVNQTSSIFENLYTVCENSLQSFIFNRQVFVAWQHSKVAFEDIIFVAIFMAFVGTVGQCWFCLKFSPDLIGYLLYCWFIMTLVILFVATVIVFGVLCNIFCRTTDCVRKCRFQAKLFMFTKPSFSRKVLVKLSNSLQPITLAHDLFGGFGEGFMTNLLWSLINRVFDAIFIFEYPCSNKIWKKCRFP